LSELSKRVGQPKNSEDENGRLNAPSYCSVPTGSIFGLPGGPDMSDVSGSTDDKPRVPPSGGEL
jgi:hypothetical protein